MKRLALAIGVLALGFTATAPARADFAVAKFNNGACRVWYDASAKPADGRLIVFKHRGHLHTRFSTWDGAEKAVHRVAARKGCTHWHWL